MTNHDGQTRVLILTTSGGQGLIHGARAIESALHAVAGEQVRVQVMDFFSLTRGAGHWLTRLYNLLLRRSLLLNAVYIFVLHLLRPDRWRLLYSRSYRLLLRLLARERPDAIIFTSQYLVAFAGWALKKAHWQGVSFVANINLGSDCVPLWFDNDIDVHLLPTPEAQRAYHRYGFRSDRAVLAPMDVRPDFVAAGEMDAAGVAELRRSLGLPAEAFLVLFSGSREGYDGVASIAQAVAEIPGVTVAVICGNNARLRRRLEAAAAKRRLRLSAYGWRDDVHLLMRAANVVVAKPGIQTVKETLAVGVPLIPIAFPAVMQQETGNLEFLANRGILLAARSAQDVVTWVTKLEAEPERERAVREQIRAARTIVAPRELAELIWRRLASKRSERVGAPAP